jgi:hypothetical protein
MSFTLKIASLSKAKTSKWLAISDDFSKRVLTSD